MVFLRHPRTDGWKEFNDVLDDSGFPEAWEDADPDRELCSATAGAGRAPLDSFQSGKEKCRPPVGGVFSKFGRVLSVAWPCQA